MGRYRPPQPKSTAIITAWGFSRLQAELKAIWKKRAEVTQALAAAAAEGDRSENAEYIYRKKELRELDRRIRYLQKRLPDLQVVRERPADESRVRFAAWVWLENAAEERACYRLVGPDETGLHPGGISVDAPLAKALLGKGVDEEVEVRTPAGVREWWLLAIHYQQPEASPEPPPEPALD